MEAEMVRMAREEKRMFLSDVGLEEPGLDRLVRAGYKLLGLNPFFTAGDKEIRAWTVPEQSPAPVAAGRIHSDSQDGCIRAETIHYDTFRDRRDRTDAREAGDVRTEGKDNLVEDGDFMLFRFNV